jgi:hypothetical protein
MAITQQAFSFSLQYLAAAKANGDGTFGTAFAFPSAKTLNLSMKYISDTAEGNSIYTALAGQIVAVEWSVDGCNLDQRLLAIVSGETASSSGSALTEINTITFSNDLMPYFGLVAQAWGQHGDDMCFLIPYTKVMTGFSWKLDFGKFAAPQFKGTSINEPVLNYMLQNKNHATKLANPAFPPSWA